MLNGRYCEAGIDESQSRGANRDDLLFFEVDTSDPDSYAKKRSEPVGFFERGLEPLIQRSLDQQENEHGDFALVEKRENLTARSLSSKYYRTFHPRAVGHGMSPSVLHVLMPYQLIWPTHSHDCKRRLRRDVYQERRWARQLPYSNQPCTS
jgi:hypothetical protein